VKVLVLWADNRSGNLGVRVIAEGLAALARSAWGPETEVDFQDYGPGDSELSFGTRAIMRDFGRNSGLIKQKISQYDVVLDSGAGDSFADIYGMKRLSFMAYANRTATRMGVPIVMGPQTIGPFNSFLGRAMARNMLRNVSLVQSRDPISAEHSARLGRAVDTSSTDVVFALPVPSVAKTRDIIVNVSGLLWFSDAHMSSDTYKRRTCELVNSLTERGRTVTLLSHVTNANSVRDDAAAIRELVAGQSLTVDVLIPESLSEAREFLGSAELVIGARMHACLNAISMGTPAIPWAYSRKFAPLLADVGWDITVDLQGSSDVVSETIGILDSYSAADTEVKIDALRKLATRKLDQSAMAMRGLVFANHV
jgi:colanic acid/amylovoran biosynthesis protein